MFLTFGALLLVFPAVTMAESCSNPSPGFPVPTWQDPTVLKFGFEKISQRLDELIVSEQYKTSSFSIEVTSNTETLHQWHHTARELNETRPGDTSIDENSIYRIASITKVFTVLGILYQHEAGNLNLDDPISAYIPDFGGSLPWKDMSLRMIASQLSGIPRDWCEGDLINELDDPTASGLPPISRDGLPTCGEYSSDGRPCELPDLEAAMKKLKPVLAPNQKSTYSNTNYELLGLALANVTKMPYEEYIRSAIFEPLGMKSSTLAKPSSDDHAVLPVGDNSWDEDLGITAPSGGIYSTSKDMSTFLRYVLTHYNAIATGVNWLMPGSWSTNLNSFYGMPWEIFRTDRVLRDSRRPVTFVTKSGGLDGYYSQILLMPEYGLGLTIFVGGDHDLLEKSIEIVTTTLVQAAEDAIWKSIDEKYSGYYTAVDTDLNSSLVLHTSPSTGLEITSFISNGTEVVNTRDSVLIDKDFTHPARAQLIPTLLFKNETAQKGEIWRLVVSEMKTDSPDRPVWDDFCTTDEDIGMYGGLPIDEFVFWHEEGLLELPAWRVKMKREKRENVDLVVQH